MRHVEFVCAKHRLLSCLCTLPAQLPYAVPSFLGTQSRPKVNFLIWITR